jgi:hypothetical protein
MPGFLLRVEAVNFTNTLDDTNDLSTIRGASLAMLRANELVQASLGSVAGPAKPLFAGASLCAFTFDAPDESAAHKMAETVRAALAAAPEADGPFKHLSFVVDAVAVLRNDITAALELATARNRCRQFRQWTLPLPEFADRIGGYDQRDRMRPASAHHDFPEGRQSGSPSVIARRVYGRAQRQEFYAAETGLPSARGLRYADSFEDIVRHPPEGLPVSLRGKMAVFYADGNKFGSIRDVMDISKFSAELVNLQRGLLKSIISWYERGVQADKEQLNRFGAFDKKRAHVLDMRLETLLWGGDELAMDFLDGFFAATKDWRIGATDLTFATGLLICHHKTPIRQARMLAKELAETCKTHMTADKKLSNAASVAVFESLSPPDTDLNEYRKRLYGATTPAHEADILRALVLPGGEIGALNRQIGDMKWNDTLPRSQIYRLLRIARQHDGFFKTGAVSAIKQAAKDYVEHAGADKSVDLETFALPAIGNRSLPLTLALAAELWSYASPFKDPLPPFLHDAKLGGKP